jgi:hypothetical protein
MAARSDSAAKKWQRQANSGRSGLGTAAATTIVVVCPITPPLLREGTTTAETTVGGGVLRHSVAFGGDD